jgi:hypothetical protein
MCGVASIAKGTRSVPRKLPIQNRGIAVRAIALPEPALTKVPDPHPRIICIDNPKTKAAATMVRETGAMAPISVPGAKAIIG